MLFLLDEVLAGTNSNDRCFGASAVIEQLIGNGSVGLVTTHDLALTEAVNVLHGLAINVHFEEHYENGENEFDYLQNASRSADPHEWCECDGRIGTTSFAEVASAEPGASSKSR
jgi:hypothetical protein